MAESAHKVCIVGSGPAGYTAAIYAARANLRPVIFAGGPAESDPSRVPGGQLMITTDVENYPGFPEAVTGPDLMERFQKQAQRFGTVIHWENVEGIDFSRRPFHVKGETQQLDAQTLIIATGASARWLGVPGEHKYKNRGVSACATCDGAFFKGQDVAVVGGGDTAMEEASYLAHLCRSVTLIHRRGELRASKIMQERVLEHPKVKPLWNTVVDEVLGDEKSVTALRLRNVKTQEASQLSVTGLFIAIGHQPNTELVKDHLELQPNGYLKTVPGSTRTSVPGVFACGDVQDPFYRQAITAAGTGCKAALDAVRFLSH